MHENKNLFIFEIFLILFILFIPLFQGSVLALPLAIFQLVSFLLLALFLLGSVKNSPAKIFYPQAGIFIVLFIGVVIFELLPLPQFFLKLISPNTLEIYRNYQISFSPKSFYSLAIYSLSVKQELIKFIAFLSVFLITLNTFNKKNQFERIFLVIIIWAALLSMYGVIRKYFILEKEISESFSVFGNRNHFAAFMEMAAPLALGYALYCRDRFKKLLFSFIGAIICLSIFLSLSRGGSLSLLFSLIIMGVLLKKDWIIQEKYWALIIGSILVAVLLSIVGIEPIRYRFSLLAEGALQRFVIARDSLKIIKDFPLFGIGWGNFPYVFTFYKSFFSRGYYFYSHNDYLQLIIETGLVGFSFFFLFIFRTLRGILIELRTRQDPFVRCMVIGGVSGIFGLFIHSLVDFNFHIPAVSFLFWVLLALIYKCVFTSFRK